MKLKTIFITAVIVLAGSLTLVSAQETSPKDLALEQTNQTKISENLNNKVTLQYLDLFNHERRKIDVKITNEFGKKFYSRSFSRKGILNYALDITQLPKGDYTIEIYNKQKLVCSKVISKQIANQKDNNSMSLFANENSATKKTHQTYIDYNVNNKIDIEYLDSFSKAEREIVVRIFAPQGDLIYTRCFVKEGKLDIEFDISDYPCGDYTIELFNESEFVCSKIVSTQMDTKTSNYEAIANNE